MNDPRKAVMIDIEALGKSENAALLQIAARQFDPVTGAPIGDAFNSYVSSSQGTIDFETALWWLGQPSANAVAVLCEAGDTEEYVLGQFKAWLQDTVGIFHSDDTAEIWALSSYDDKLLTGAFRRALDWNPPWHYRCPRDLRTMIALAGVRKGDVPRDESRKHDAAADVDWQIEVYALALRRGFDTMVRAGAAEARVAELESRLRDLGET